MACSNNEGFVQRGNTARLTAQFNDWDDAPIDPDIVKVIVYDRKWTKLHEQELSVDNRKDVGNYFYDYVPEEIGRFYIEWQGRIEGQPSLHRSTLIVRDL